MNSWFHAQAAARKWGGKPENYIDIIEFMDSSKSTFGDVRHRALLHNTFGVWIAQRVFGRTITIEKPTGGTYEVPVREIAEQHIIEDLGFIPEVGDWLNQMNIVAWMGGKRHKFVGREELLNKIVKEAR